MTFNVIQNPPNYAVVALNNVPITTANLGAFADNRGLVPLPNTTLRAVDPNIKPVYAENWNLTIEHQLDPTTMVTAGYIGSRGIHLYSIANFNRQFRGANYLPACTIASCDPIRLNLQYGGINFRGSDADSYYHAVNFGLRSSNIRHTGLSSIVNYTFGKSIDNNSSTFGDGLNGASGFLGYLDPFNHALDRGPSDFDTKQRLTAGLVWETPFFKHSVGIEKSLLGGWVASTTFNCADRQPLLDLRLRLGIQRLPACSLHWPPPQKAQHPPGHQWRGLGTQHLLLPGPARLHRCQLQFMGKPQFRHQRYATSGLGGLR